MFDMHVCPMQTPAVVPIPHVGGPIISPCAPTVLIGMQPAARITDMCVCVGPPDSIVRGSAGVMIVKLNAARIGDNCAHGGVIVQGLPTVIIGEVGVVTPSMPTMPALPEIPAMPEMPAGPGAALADLAKATTDLMGVSPAALGKSLTPPKMPSPEQAAAAVVQHLPAAARAAAQVAAQMAAAPAAAFAGHAAAAMAALGNALAAQPMDLLPPGAREAIDNVKARVDQAKAKYEEAKKKVEEVRAAIDARVDEAKAKYDQVMAEKKKIEDRVNQGIDQYNDAVKQYEETRAALKQQIDDAKKMGNEASKTAKQIANTKPPKF